MTPPGGVRTTARPQTVAPPPSGTRAAAARPAGGGWSVRGALALAGAAVLLPPRAAALELGAEPALLARVIAGLWLLKGLLLLHALLLAVLPRVPLRTGADARPLSGARHPRADGAAGRVWPRVRGREAAALAAVLVIALVLRLRDLGDGLWFDEIQTLVSYVRLPVGRLLTTYDSQNQHMLFSLLARGSVRLFGESAWSLRLPAALLGVGSVAATWAFARRVTGRVEALLAAALLAVSYQHVWFSQNARGYTGLLLGTLLSSTIFLELLRGEGAPRWRPAVAYAATMALTLWIHATAAFVLAAHGLVWLALAGGRAREWRSARVWLPLAAMALAGTFALLLYAPVLPQFGGTLGGETMAGVATRWKNPAWLGVELLRGLARGVPGGLLSVALALVVFAAGVVSFARRDRAVIGLMLLPVAVTALAILAMHHNLWPRFFFAYAGFLVLITVRGVFALAPLASRRHGRTLAAGALALAALGSAWTVRHAWGPKQDYGGALAYVRGHRQPGDALAAVDMSDYVLRRYLGARSLPAESAEALAAVERRHAHTWLIYTFPDRLAAVHPSLWQEIHDRYHVAAKFGGTLGGGTVFVAVNR